MLGKQKTKNVYCKEKKHSSTSTRNCKVEVILAIKVNF